MQLLDGTRLSVILTLYDEARRAELFALFRQQAGAGLGAVREGAAARDAAATARAAHCLASCAGNFACAALHTVAVRLAHTDATRQWGAIEEDVRQLEVLYPQTLVALEAKLDLRQP